MMLPRLSEFIVEDSADPIREVEDRGQATILDWSPELLAETALQRPHRMYPTTWSGVPEQRTSRSGFQ